MLVNGYGWFGNLCNSITVTADESAKSLRYTIMYCFVR